MLSNKKVTLGNHTRLLKTFSLYVMYVSQSVDKDNCNLTVKETPWDRFRIVVVILFVVI